MGVLLYSYTLEFDCRLIHSYSAVNVSEMKREEIRRELDLLSSTASDVDFYIDLQYGHLTKSFRDDPVQSSASIAERLVSIDGTTMRKHPHSISRASHHIMFP